jgi:phosphoenolpyruvate carboxykinase (GTP)
MTRQIILADRVLASDIELTGWAGEAAELTKPDHIAWCDGSYPEWERLTDLLVEQGTFTRLNPRIRPDSFHCPSDPSDVARRGPDHHLLGKARGRRPHEQLDRPG